MAMLPFCGYNMGDYFAHWLKIGEKGGDKLPKIFYVNWFRKSPEGKFLWPGFAENSRVLKWIFERCDGKAAAIDTPIGKVPTEDALDTNGLDVDDSALKELLRVDIEGWKAEIPLDQGALRHLRRQAARRPEGRALRTREAPRLARSRLDTDAMSWPGLSSRP